MSLTWTFYGQVEGSGFKPIDFSGLNLPEPEPIQEDPKPEVNTEFNFTPLANPISPKAKDGFQLESIIDAENFGTLKPLQMQFGKAPKTNKYTYNEQPKYLRTEPGISKIYQRDQRLGELFTNSEYLVIRFRDYGSIDGDIIRLLINDEVVVDRAVLVSNWKEYRIKMKTGIYKIDFMALNMGNIAPNTAHLVIIDDNNTRIMNNQWSLSTGFKASVVVVKEE